MEVPEKKDDPPCHQSHTFEHEWAAAPLVPTRFDHYALLRTEPDGRMRSQGPQTRGLDKKRTEECDP